MKIKAIVLAAGMGKRLQSEAHDLPKVLRLCAGRPLLAYVLDAIDFIPSDDIHIVVGYKRERVMSAFPEYRFAVQEQQLGTGHAVKSALETIPDYDGDLLVCCGDMPLIEKETYKTLVNQHTGVCTILSGEAEGLPYGRIIRDAEGGFLRIVEDRDCSEEERAVTELNSGVYIFRASELRSALDRIGSDNAQGEQYLTDVPAIELADGHRIGLCRLPLGIQLLGVNTPEQLEAAEREILAR